MLYRSIDLNFFISFHFFFLKLSIMIRAKQRTKTGCLTCVFVSKCSLSHHPFTANQLKGRGRKKKCGEEIPICHRCSASGQICTWPSQSDLFDRRYRLTQRSSLADTKYPVSHPPVASSIENELLNHFLRHFLPGLVSSAWDRNRFMEYQNHVMDLILNIQSVKHAVLASSASNLSMLTGNNRYENFALGFYSRAVNEVNRSLTEMSLKNLTPNDALIVAVIYLCIHDVSFRSKSLY